MPETNLLTSHPHIGVLYQLYASETQAFRKVHRMIDLFESIIKMHTVVILSEYVAENKLSESTKGLLAQGLRTPSLGTWQLFSRVLFEELEKDQFAWSLPIFAKEFADLDKALNNEKTNVIAFRNGYAHGATPTDEACAADISKFEPFLTKLLQAQWLLESSLEVVEGKVFLCSNDEKLSLHPILLHRDENTEASFAFFNDLKNDKIGLLNYPLGKHYREKEFLNEFHQYIPINEWKKTGANEFQQRIEELTETFKGRTAERKQLLNFVVEKQKGYCSIQGNPGIGKSALIAQFFKDLRLHESCKDIQVIEYFIRRGTQQAKPEVLLEYLIKKTDELFPKAREIRAEGKMVFDLQNQLFTKWRLWAEHCKGTKLLFLIDGLDEGVEESIIQYLPKENFQNILFIYGSRPGGHKSIDELWGNLPIEHHLKIELSGLGKEDIRAMIYEVANKYEIEKDSAWIEAIQQRSQGNPLYLKLLCDAIANKSIGLNDINALPKEIDEYYKAILFRYAQDSVDGDALLDSLYTFAAAKDYLSFAHIGLINKLGEAKLQRIGSTLKEVLIENPLTEDVQDYQLFHESFREYLFKEKSFKITEANEQIINYCASWKELEGIWEQRYALEFYADHLSESQKAIHQETLLKLIEDKAYLSAQKKVLRHFKAANKLMQLAIEKSAELQNQDTLLEAALCLVDLKYEEDNDAPRILEMVANGEIDIAIQRIEAFGTNDKEGLERKFMLYMLCLMELTLLESKEKSFRKEAIEKLLKHLDGNLPIDHSILNWNDFFSSYLIFQMACDWAELGLDYLIVYKRTEYWDCEWIADKGPFSSKHFHVLKESVSSISTDLKKSRALKEISVELCKLGQFEKSHAVARVINDAKYKCYALKEISIELCKQSQFEVSELLMQESLSTARGIIGDNVKKCSALKEISVELGKMGKLNESVSVMQESLTIAYGISDDYWKSTIIKDISSELSKLGYLDESVSEMKESLAIARGISSDTKKILVLTEISLDLFKQGKFDESELVLQESLSIARGISNDLIKFSVLKDISLELSKQGKLQESLSIARGIPSDRQKSRALKEISVELIKQGQLEESLSIARGISDDREKSRALKEISVELIKQGQLEESAFVMQESLSIARGIIDDREKSRALKEISVELIKQGHLEESAFVMQESLSIARGINDEMQKSSALKEISAELSRLGQFEESLSIARGISDESERSSVLKEISLELCKQGLLELSILVIQESLATARGISNESYRSFALRYISLELSKQGLFEESLSIARGISDESKMSNLIRDISFELSKLGQLKESLSIARGISNDRIKFYALQDISLELSKLGQFEESLSIARGMSDEIDKSLALKDISLELCKQGQFDESLTIAHSISNESEMCSTLKGISIELIKHGLFEESLSIARGITSERKKSLALKEISLELSKQGQFEESLNIAYSISDESEMCSALKGISIDLSKKGQLEESLAIACGICNEIVKSRALKDISLELCKQGQFDESLTIAHSIGNQSEMCSALRDISLELNKQGQFDQSASVMQESLAIARVISDYRKKCYALKEISLELSKQGQFEESLSIARSISSDTIKYNTLKEISLKLCKQGQFEESLSIARGISGDRINCIALKNIAEELSKQGNCITAEEVGKEISWIAERHSCWMEIARNTIESLGWKVAVKQFYQYQSKEAQVFFLKGIAEHINIIEVTDECLQDLIPILSNDTWSLEFLLQKYIIKKLIMEKVSAKEEERLNKTLNLQWVLDITSKFEKEFERASHNVQEWIIEIADENDREDILGWAEKVQQGKMTEEKFLERINKL